MDFLTVWKSVFQSAPLSIWLKVEPKALWLESLTEASNGFQMVPMFAEQLASMQFLRWKEHLNSFDSGAARRPPLDSTTQTLLASRKGVSKEILIYRWRALLKKPPTDYLNELKDSPRQVLKGKQKE